MVTATKPSPSKSDKKRSQYIGDNLNLNLTGGKDKNFALVGNNCNVRLHDHDGSLKVIGNNNKIRIAGGSGKVTYIGNQGKITLDHQLPQEIVKYIGKNGEINTYNADKTEVNKVKVENTPTFSTSKNSHIDIQNYSGIRISMKKSVSGVPSHHNNFLNTICQLSEKINKTNSKK